MLLIANIFVIIIALLVNFYIIQSDIEKKKIPNIGILILMFLAIFWYGLYGDVSIDGFKQLCIQGSISLLVSFLLYFYGVWSAGDAKYVFVLSLFLSQDGIFAFIGNLALVTIAYLIIYYFYFYFRLLFSGKNTISSFIWAISISRKNIINRFIAQNKKENEKISFSKLFSFFLLFFIFFIGMRLFNFYVVEYIKTNPFWIQESLKSPSTSGFFGGIIIFLWFYAFRKSTGYIKKILDSIFLQKNWSYTYIKPIFIGILCVILALFIGYQFEEDPKKILHKLFLIFTVYLFLYILIRIVLYSYKIVFEVHEQEIIPIEALQPGDIVEKKILIDLIGEEQSIGFKKEWKLLSPDPRVFLRKMDNPIDAETCYTLQKAYGIINEEKERWNTSGQKLETIRILKTFPFGVYIFLWFIITLLLKEEPIRWLWQRFISILWIFN